MCPDNTLLSAFYDGEVSSPWKDQIEEHLLVCEKCRAVVESYREQSRILQSAPEPALSSSFSDLEHMIRQRNTVDVSTSFRTEHHRWPVLPMAAAAAAIFAFFMGFGLAQNNSPVGSYMTSAIAVSDGWTIPDGDLTVSGEDIDALLSLLEPSDSQMFNQETSMELPVDLNLDIYGDSQLMKTASLSGGASR